MSRSRGHSFSATARARADRRRGRRMPAALGDVRGFTLTETLAAVVVVGLVTCCLAVGITMASTHFFRSMAQSEAYMLFTTLQRTLDTELRYTSTVFTDGTTEEGGYTKLIGFESQRYMAAGEGRLKATPYLRTRVKNPEGTYVPQKMDRFGELVFCAKAYESYATTITNPIVGAGQYNNGLKVKVERFSYHAESRDFKLVLTIGQGEGSDEDVDVLVSQAFTVRALNDPAVKLSDGK